MSQALYESVILVGLEGRAVLGNYLVKPLDAAVAHSLIGGQYGNGIYGLVRLVFAHRNGEGGREQEKSKCGHDLTSTRNGWV